MTQRPPPVVRDAPDADPTPTASRRRPRRSLVARASFYLASASLVVWAAFVVRLPVIEYIPGTPTAIPPLVEIDGVETTELDGETSLLTILLRQQPTVPALGALLDAGRDLVPLDRVYQPGIDRQVQLEAGRDLFDRQFELAAVVGARAAGVDADLDSEVVVRYVEPGSPAEGRLRRGDVIVEAAGEPIAAAEELQALTRAADPGDTLTLSIRRDGREQEIAATLEEVGEQGQVRLGVGIETAVLDVALPFEVAQAEDTRIGGTSAGMMVALTIYDLLAEEDLLDGRTVMGTGTLDADGRVGPIGGIEQKMVAAADAGAEVVLVPALQLDTARAAAPDGLDVVGVATLDEAIEALRR